MVRQGLLTAFQASQLGHGRWMGFEVGNYRILDRLGAGGMGQVFLAEHMALGKRVALKVLSRQCTSPLAMERFLREARAAAKLDHPNIIRVYDINPNHDPPFIVMEYADGITLQAAVVRNGPFAPGNAASIGQQMALGLDEAYRHGLVHRDVKPANVLVDRRGVARLLDLGIVRIEGEDLTSEYEKNVILGTIEYFAPEQAIDSSKVDTRADIYSLGATLYFLLAGNPPLPSGSMQERLAQLQAVDPPHLSLWRPEMPAGLAEVIHCMLAKSPADRYQTPLLAAEALAPFAHVKPPFPTNLFRHVRSTLSDMEGTPTPAGGIVLPITEMVAEPTEEHRVEFHPRPMEAQSAQLCPVQETDLARTMGKSERQAAARSSSTISAWCVAGIAAIFGLLAIAFYISK
jgi:serine/threonine protein kinase